MDVIQFVNKINFGFFTGVPDSQLKPLCDYLTDCYGISEKHIIAANEGSSTALAAGYHLATGNIPVVYMQNSGIGNIINPAASLLHEDVYGIPCIFIVGWRGEPDTHDEPQHKYQGKVTLKLLEDMDIATFVIRKSTTDDEFESKISAFKPLLESGKSVAFIICKDALKYDETVEYKNNDTMNREEVIRHITAVSGEDIVISTTGKASRELFEIRESKGQSHKYDFLTVGSMGHSSSIAMSIAQNKPNSKVWCIDGDGAALMHMGAMALIGANKVHNMVHIVINNGAHETVGGMPAVSNKIDFVKIAEGCGYELCTSVQDYEALDQVLNQARTQNKLTFIEVKTAIGSRSDLGRPTTSAKSNKENFMNYLKALN